MQSLLTWSKMSSIKYLFLTQLALLLAFIFNHYNNPTASCFSIFLMLMLYIKTLKLVDEEVMSVSK